MKIYTAKTETSSERRIVADDMILTKDMPTAAGSKMLDGYMSLFEAEVLTRLKNAGYEISGKADVGEFAIDLLGETSYNGAVEEDGVIKNASAKIVKDGEALASINLDVNGYVRRAAAQSGLVSVKPTYGTVSRFGTIPAACSGDTISVMAGNACECKAVLEKIAGHDDKDGTSLPEEKCALITKEAGEVKKVAVITSMLKGADDEVKGLVSSFAEILKKNGIEVCEEENEVIKASKVAWNILMSAELCNNVSRYDGVKYGYRTENFTNIDELYTNSRTEAFGELLKTAILFGSETLSTENYMKVYDKALRTRRVIVEAFEKLFESYDAVIMPACSSMKYTAEQLKENKYMVFEENFYTAPASVTGLPVVTVGGIQITGKAFSESKLFAIAEMYEKEAK